LNFLSSSSSLSTRTRTFRLSNLYVL
jgi:hypothetical protein